MALPNKTMVRTFEELRHAASIGARYIYVSGMIPMQHKVTFGSDCDLYPQSKEGCGFDFAPMQWDGDWDQAVSNGIELKAENHKVVGLNFINFDRNGSALKGHVDNVLEIESCTFRDNCIIMHEPQVSPAPTLSHTLTGMCIGSHQVSEALIVTGCSFINCCHQSNRWGRPIYASAKEMFITDNTFTRTCNIGLGAQPGSRFAEVRNNTFHANAWIYEPEKGGSLTASWAIGFGDGIDSHIIGNRYIGMFANFYRNDWPNNNHVFEDNDYTLAEPPQHGWAWYSGIGYVSRENWGKE